MSLRDDLLATPDVGLALAAALEAELGDDVLLTVGEPRSSLVDVLQGSARTVEMPFTLPDGAAGVIALTAVTAFAEQLESAAADELFTTTSRAGLAAAVAAIGALVPGTIDVRGARETDGAALEELTDAVAVPILLETDVVACMTVVLDVASTREGAAAAPAPEAAVAVAHGSVAERDGAPSVLVDVELGVTAELGRCQMTVRDLLAIAPGAIIDLDRPVGAPVDLLVNGTPVARGEVVVLDEEFAIRISEILT